MHHARPDGYPPPDGIWRGFSFRKRARYYHHCGRDRVTHHAPCPSRPSRQHTSLFYGIINSGGQQASSFSQIHTPSLVLLPGLRTSTPPEVCLPVCGSCCLFGRLFDRLYNGRGANGTASLLHSVILFIWPRALCLVTPSFTSPPSATHLI